MWLTDCLQGVLSSIDRDYAMEDSMRIKLPRAKFVTDFGVAHKMAKLAGRPVVVSFEDIVYRVHPSGREENLTELLEEIQNATQEDDSVRES